jgi:hypothetical protein
MKWNKSKKEKTLPTKEQIEAADKWEAEQMETLNGFDNILVDLNMVNQLYVAFVAHKKLEVEFEEFLINVVGEEAINLAIKLERWNNHGQ